MKSSGNGNSRTYVGKSTTIFASIKRAESHRLTF